MRRSLIQSRRKKPHQMINPMESVVNLIDIMLIFACGLMVSLVSLWGLDMSKANQDADTDSGYYQDMGQVYKDPNTGKVYVVKTVENQTEGAAATASSSN